MKESKLGPYIRTQLEPEEDEVIRELAAGSRRSVADVIRQTTRIAIKEVGVKELRRRLGYVEGA